MFVVVWPLTLSLAILNIIFALRTRKIYQRNWEMLAERENPRLFRVHLYWHFFVVPVLIAMIVMFCRMEFFSP